MNDYYVLLYYNWQTNDKIGYLKELKEYGDFILVDNIVDASMFCESFPEPTYYWNEIHKTNEFVNFRFVSIKNKIRKIKLEKIINSIN